MADYRRRPKTRLQTENEKLRLLHLPDACLSLVLGFACQDVPWKQRCRLAEVCTAFRALFSAQAFAGRPLCLDLNRLSWRLADGYGGGSKKKRGEARAGLLAAIARYAPSVSHLWLRYQLDRCAGVSLAALLAPLAPRVRRLDVDDGLCTRLLESLAQPGWGALQEVSFTGCNLWIDLDAGELGALERQLASLPQLCSKIVTFECSCQGMQEGGESFFRHLTALRSLELEDWVSWDVPRDYAPLRAMPHLTRLVLNIVEDLAANMDPLLSLTQVQELSLQGCYHASRGLPRLTNLVMLDLQEIGPDANGEHESAAAWKAGSLTELRWCGDLFFDEGPAPVQLPRLVALEIDEAYFPASGFHPQLCTALTQLTSLRIVGGRCPKLPAAISNLAQLKVLAIDSCMMPKIPPAISALTAVTSLTMSNSSISPHLPSWVLHLPVRKLWLANNQLTTLLPAGGAKKQQERKAAWLARLTHVCLSSNSLREAPAQLLENSAELAELDLAYNHHLQLTNKTADQLAKLSSLRSLRLEKSYWLRLQDRWTKPSLRAIHKLQKERPDIQVDYQHMPGAVRLAW